MQEAVKKLGYPPKEEDIVRIKVTLKGSVAPEPVVEPSDEQKRNLRINELVNNHGRRDLEDMLRNLGFEPSKQDYPDKLSLAKAIAEKEVQPEVEGGTP